MSENDARAQIEALISKARKAQKIIEEYTQEQVDALVRAVAKVIFDNAASLARMAVDETGMGVYEDKVKKNRGKARLIWNDMKNGKSVGIIRELPELGLVEVAKPMGVVGAVTPSTNPIVTPMCNAMFALKGRNALIISPHPGAKRCSCAASTLMRKAIEDLGAPGDLLQIVEEPSVELSGWIMKLCDVCISTGGAGMVRAAYSSGKPAFGVGAGNVQCLIDLDVDVKQAVPMIIEGRRFDNGIICSGEQTAIMPRQKYDEIVAEFIRSGAHYIDAPEEINAIRDALFPNGIMNKKCVGKSAFIVAQIAGISVPEDTKILLVKGDKYGMEEPLAKEKMCPVLVAYAYDTWAEGVNIANENLLTTGKGHSVCIHSHNRDNINYAAQKLPASRFLLNQICATANGGSFFNSLAATTTLGCGSWGNNSISENLSWRHLFNVSRIASLRPGATEPSDEEIWGVE